MDLPKVWFTSFEFLKSALRGLRVIFQFLHSIMNGLSTTWALHNIAVIVHTRISRQSCSWILRYLRQRVRTFHSFANSVSVLALLKCAISSLVNATYLRPRCMENRYAPFNTVLSTSRRAFCDVDRRCFNSLESSWTVNNTRPYSFMSPNTHFLESAFVCMTPDVFRSSAALWEAVEASIRSCHTNFTSWTNILTLPVPWLMQRGH